MYYRAEKKREIGGALGKNDIFPTMKCYAIHKKIWEIGGALGKNDIFPLCPYTSTHPPQNSDTPSL